MALIDDINKAQKKGHKITWRKRTDGGIIVTSVDGQKYNAGKGNARVRELAGTKLSTGRERQLQNITTRAGTKEAKKRKAGYDKTPDLQQELQRAQRRINRKRRKNSIDGGGYISKKKIEWHLNNEGVEETKKWLHEAEKYSEGIAYSENVRWLKLRIEDEMNNSTKFRKEWKKIYDKIEATQDSFKERDLQEIYNILGSPKAKNAEMGNSEETKINKIKRLLNIA